MTEYCDEPHPEPHYGCRCPLPPNHAGQHRCHDIICGERWGADQMHLHDPQQPTRVKSDEDGTLDDFFATGVKYVHFEALDQSQWYLSVERDNGEIWQLKFGACNDRAKGYAFAEQIGDAS